MISIKILAAAVLASGGLVSGLALPSGHFVGQPAAADKSLADVECTNPGDKAFLQGVHPAFVQAKALVEFEKEGRCREYVSGIAANVD